MGQLVARIGVVGQIRINGVNGRVAGYLRTTRPPPAPLASALPPASPSASNRSKLYTNFSQTVDIMLNIKEFQRTCVVATD